MNLNVFNNSENGVLATSGNNLSGFFIYFFLSLKVIKTLKKNIVCYLTKKPFLFSVTTS